MGKRGPKPAPSELKLARGTFKASRDQSLETMPRGEALVSLPRVPKTLGRIGAAIWKEDGVKLIVSGVLRDIDLRAFEIYCQAFDEVAACDKTLESGEYITMESGYVAQHPAIARRKVALDRIRRYQELFGMTPSSRAGVKANPVSTSNEVISRKRG